MGQDGNAILFTTRADNGNATVIEDIEFSGNIVRGSGGGMNILGSEGAGGHRLTVRNNIFDDLDGSKWGGTPPSLIRGRGGCTPPGRGMCPS